jgi:exosortase E/protease (VPEID-CTERM system)
VKRSRQQSFASDDNSGRSLAGSLAPPGSAPTHPLFRGTVQPWFLLFRVVLLCALFALQIEAVEIGMRRYFDASNMPDSVWMPFYDYRHHVFSFVVVFPSALFLIIWPRCRHYYRQFISATTDHHWLPWLVPQLITYGLFALLTYQLSVHPDYFAGYTSLGLLLCAALLLATGLLWLLTLAPTAFWRGWLTAEKHSLALAAGAAVVAASFTIWLRDVTPLLAIGSLHGAHFLIGLLFDPVVFDIATRSVGTAGFSVQVSNDCAGYEGIGLVTVFLAVYLWLFRRDFRFPLALLAFPIGIAVIWLFNVIRITTLIAIGDSLSAEVAMAGFHSNAGWIAFIAVSVGLIGLLHKVPLFAQHSPHGASSVPIGVPPRIVEALLLPFIVLLASGLLLGALSAGFDQLYPLKVLATAAALWHFRKVYNFVSYRLHVEPVAVGLLVFLVWLLLVPASPEQSATYTAQFAQWSPAVALLWIVFRLLGSVITVPLVEELAFRGYLLTRLGGKLPSINSRIPFNLFAFVVSSVLFGLLHSAWLAGIVAGMAYAWVRYRRGQLGDAVVAHMTTNLLLSGYALATGQWSYW